MDLELTPGAHLDIPSREAQASQGLVFRNLEPHPHLASPLCSLSNRPHPPTLENRSGEVAGGGGEGEQEQVAGSSHASERPLRTTPLACTPSGELHKPLLVALTILYYFISAR